MYDLIQETCYKRCPFSCHDFHLTAELLTLRRHHLTLTFLHMISGLKNATFGDVCYTHFTHFLRPFKQSLS